MSYQESIQLAMLKEVNHTIQRTEGYIVTHTFRMATNGIEVVAGASASLNAPLAVTTALRGEVAAVSAEVADLDILTQIISSAELTATLAAYLDVAVKLQGVIAAVGDFPDVADLDLV